MLGETVTLNGLPYEIVGVMHPRWTFGGRDLDLFVPGGRFVIDQGDGMPRVIEGREALIALARQLRALLSRPAEMTRRSEAALRRARNFTWNSTRDRTIEELERALS